MKFKRNLLDTSLILKTMGHFFDLNLSNSYLQLRNVFLFARLCGKSYENKLSKLSKLESAFKNTKSPVL